MNMHYKTLGLLTSLICLVGCNDFLEQSPDDRAIIDEAEKVGELLVLAYPTANHQAFCYAMSDNATDKVSSRRKDDSNKNAYYWEDFTLTNQDTPDHFWNGCYSAIKQANHALAVIEPLIKNGIVPEEYAPFYGEALLCRAYSHFMLVNLWSPQYNPSTADTDLGIPYVVEPETVVLKDYKRGTVAEVYNKIEQDILTGIKYLDEYTYSGNKMRLHWNNKAASTFAARFYSMKGDFQKVLDYTNQVITDEPTSILRQLNTTYKNMNITDAVPLWTRSTQSCNLLVTPQYSNWFSNLYGNYQYGMSFPLYDYVFKGRIQYREVHKEPFVAVKENWQDVNDDGTPDYLGYLDTWYWDAYGSSDLQLYKWGFFRERDGLNSETGYYMIMNVLFDAEEALFLRMEANAMLGNNPELITKDMDAYISTRLKVYDADANKVTLEKMEVRYKEDVAQYELNPFYTIPDDARTYLNCIYDLRRKEYYFTGMRWFDQRRFNVRVRHYIGSEDEIVLEPNDVRRQLQIPESALAYGLEANPR